MTLALAKEKSVRVREEGGKERNKKKRQKAIGQLLCVRSLLALLCLCYVFAIRLRLELTA